MIRLFQTHAEGSDCTAPYDVILDREYTVGEFIEEILKSRPNEWGYFSIGGFFCQRLDYGRGALKDPVLMENTRLRVAKVSAAGGWSRMDYYIKLVKD